MAVKVEIHNILSFKMISALSGNSSLKTDSVYAVCYVQVKCFVWFLKKRVNLLELENECSVFENKSIFGLMN